jgi:UDP-glucuronate 4-epimerase
LKILVTGMAGFIGMHAAAAFAARGDDVVGIDNLNDYYDPQLKRDRLAELQNTRNIQFERADIADAPAMMALFQREKFDRVVHLAAQAGVRYSLTNPHAYVTANLAGFVSILEACRHTSVGHLIHASSSSVYGANTRLPFSTQDAVDHPVSLYAATKKSNELMAHTYAHLYRLPVTGLRFFTVYGPWGRPDMAPFSFTQKILRGEQIEIFNNGDMARDFTYIDDVVAGVVHTTDRIASPDPAWDANNPNPSTSSAPYRVYNIGNSSPVPLLDFVAAIEQATGRQATKIMKPMQPGDVQRTFADVSDLERDVGYRPDTPIDVGMQRFVDWYRSYYKV